MIRCYLVDTVTGAVDVPIDIPNISWSASVADSSLSTARDKGSGGLDATGLSLPWAAVPSSTQAGREAMLASWRRSVLVCWETGGFRRPLALCAIGDRTDTFRDTSFSCVSPMQMLGSRYLVREGDFGAGDFTANRTKTSTGTSYGRQIGRWRPYLSWTRVETPTEVSLSVTSGVEAMGGEADVPGIEVTTAVTGTEQKSTYRLSHSSASSRKYAVHTGSGTVARGDTKLSAKASCQCRIVVGMLKNGKPKYETSTATTSAGVVTQAEYEAKYTGLDKTSHGSVTTGKVAFSHRSLRAICAEVGRMCTSSKPGGSLPIDWQYVGEAGSHSAEYDEGNVSQNSCRAIIEGIADMDGGPDVALVPYMADESHVRLRFEAGSDGSPELSRSKAVPTLACFPVGGSLTDVEVGHLGPTMRVYATGAGKDQAQLCALAEDLSLSTGADPWPLSEETVSYQSDDDAGALESHARGRLAMVSRPLCQIRGKASLNDRTVASIVPGDVVDVLMDGFPALPDRTYRLRLMEEAGDTTPMVTLTFDVMANPWYQGR